MSAPAPRDPAPNIENLGDLVAELFDKYVDLVPGTKGRRESLIALSRRTVAAIDKNHLIQARRLSKQMQLLTAQQLALVAKLVENPT